MFGHTRPFSYSPSFKGFSQDDPPLQRRAFLEDDLKEASLQRRSTMSRPNAKSIYMQRKEYSETLNKQSGNFHVRVEHLFTCELDGQELKTVDDCVAKLKRLDGKGRLWPQEMIMEVQRDYLVLSDIETKAELESMPLSCILKTKAVLDSCAYNSLLTITVQERHKRIRQVYMFQCEETGAEHIKSDLDKAAKKGDDDLEPRREQSDIRMDLENIIGQQALGGFRQFGPRPVQQERPPSPLEYQLPQWREPEEFPRVYTPDLHELRSSPEVPLTIQQENTDRNTDILNHVLDDLELFVGKMSAAVNAPSQREDKSNKKGVFKKKKTKNNAAAVSLPPLMEYVSCLQKIKYGFNLLGQLDGSLSNLTAPDYVHIIFSILQVIAPQYPADLPPTVISPLLTVPALRLISETVNPQEDNLWMSLGDSWNLPRSKWPEDVPPYIPQFYDGWQPPAPLREPSLVSYESRPASRSSSQRFTLGQRHPAEPVTNGTRRSPNPPYHNEPPQYVEVISNFMARNNQELSVMKGDMVQRDTHGPVTLDMASTPAEVKAWLEYKGFSRITVNSLGVLTGKMLLGMTKDDLRTVCPEEGGKVFFQLQAIKSAIALASEPSGLYNGRY
ncbi:epidermal growth factor receptor kinase substrate 8-like protein 3b isoform X2 [Chelmon rostratus]|uniref:epidermal growth factor receptor kinase substrate 8-like protein 3b isoform X2 n=1 Tax=Chelmon rostratus TaxID=109905 RepID=UPI001BE99E3C|nr:epidermal growth factor receptor kinase substrate 8-like protein 3b isoform X2 [Chelmon rostratus]